MFLIMLAGCFEHTRETLDVQVNVSKQTVVVDAVYADITPDLENLSTAPIEEVVAALTKERDDTLARLAGAEAIAVRYVLHEGVLDLAIHAEGPFSFWQGDRGEPLRAGTILSAGDWAHHKPGKPIFGMWFEESAKQRVTFTGTGAFEVARLGGDTPVEFVNLVTLRKGKGVFHLENQLLAEDGTPTKGSGWAAAMPALPEALKGAGLL